MGKSAQNKELLNALSTAFNIKKKHINIQQSEDGSYQLKIKKNKRRNYWQYYSK
jgi:hypothetical protein